MPKHTAQHYHCSLGQFILNCWLGGAAQLVIHNAYGTWNSYVCTQYATQDWQCSLWDVMCLTLFVTLPRAVLFAFGKEREVGLEDRFKPGCAFSKLSGFFCGTVRV